MNDARAAAMQAEVNRACQHLTSMDLTVNLEEALRAALPSDTVRATIAFIAQRRKPGEKDPATDMLEMLTKIKARVLQNLAGDVVRCTGTVSFSYGMCLFVCDLLQHPSMSFLDLVQKHREYADTFFDYMIENLSQKIKVVEHTSDNSAASAVVTSPFADLKPQGADEVFGTCFICAKQEEYKNTPQKVLVLDEFSETDQFVKYPPVVLITV
jgi:hypothetical protein